MTFSVALTRSRRFVLQAACIVMIGSISVAAAAPARPSPVRLGEVGISVQNKRELKERFRSALDDELHVLELGKVAVSERYILSANLVRLESVTAERRVRASCEVSVALRRQNGNVLHAIIKGRASAEEGKPEAAQNSALRAAVHSAVRRVPDAIKTR